LGYGAGRLVGLGRWKSFWFWLAVALSLLVLAVFKLLAGHGPNVLFAVGFPAESESFLRSLAIPLGLSYVTFQVISYLADVKKGVLPAERDGLRLAAYLLFFPKFISGPLVRYKAFQEQLILTPSAEDVAAGIRRFLAGFAKRVLLANTLAVTVDAAFGLDAPDFSTGIAWLVLSGYALQIYFDFSGYIDMGLGLARMLGVRLPENFNLPYLAESVGDFWRRWHMTLSAWFREYVFFPLERRRLRWIGQPLNILIVFALTGLWHGVKPTFLLWGLIHGLAIALETLFLGRFLKTLWRPLRSVYALMVVMAAWVFFRSRSLDFSFGFFRRLAGDESGVNWLPFADTTPLPIIEPTFILALILGALFCLPVGAWWRALRARLEARSPGWFLLFQPVEDGFLVALFVLSLAFVLGRGFAPNIYAGF
jgi:alginate O-acetyltransferase complex protein AlgI